MASSLGAAALGSSFWSLRRNRLRAASFSVLLAFLAIGKTARDVRSEGDIGLTVRALFERLGARAFVDPSRVTGTLRVEPELGSEDTTLTLEVNGIRMGGARGEIPVRGGIRATVYGSFNEKLSALAAGDGVVLWGRLRRPRAFGNPAAFDVESYLERENVDAVASVKSALLVELEPRRPTVSSAMSFVRVLARRRLEHALAGNESTLGVVLALTTGDRSRLPPDLERLYQASGIYHVMAISGAHVAIIAWALHALMKRLAIDEAPRLVLLLLVLPLYAGFCSGRPPVVRAVVMACVLVGARLSSLDRPGANALAVGATALLAFEPRWLGDPGFQLSFAAMAGILLLTEPLSRRLRRLGVCATPLSLSISAQLGVVPLAAWHFQRLTPLAPIASLIALPLAGCLVVLGLVGVLVSGIPVVSDVLRELASLFVFLLTKTAEAASWPPPAAWVVSRPSLILSIAYLGATVALTARTRLWTRIGLAAMIALFCALTVSPPAPRGRLVLSAFDVGHGDALLVTLPDGKHVLVDGGGAGGGSSFDIGERVLLPCLLENGVRRLSAVVVTHTHLDHLGGLFAVVDRLKVDEMWEGSSPVDRPAYFALRRRAERRGVVVRSLEVGQAFELGGAGFEVLASGMPGSSENDQSLVLGLTYAGRRILLTGDVESPAEHRLLASGASLESDVLKVAHHGSRSSSSVAFLAAVAPRLAILSARASPGRPLPSARILHRLRALGIDYLRTDEDGAITVSVDRDGKLEVSTYRGQSS
ncbi:MAG TPA: DNA internalization-related competence protein ComEC/Rec2 [Vicinamibacteria bacterium]|nr:DNA internalization-related competence protein ComEC/Rec2 [Vicinamibacteria bacterium]